MKRRQAVKTMGALALLSGAGLPRRASAGDMLKIGTLFPKSSPWGHVFTTWEKAVQEKSGGRLELQFFYNGQQGDEPAMVGKMKSGQLDGAAVSCVGLSKIHRPILALQLPGLFTSWSKLDAARNAMKGEFDGGLDTAGFSNLGWLDIGIANILSKGFPVYSPEDIRGKKPFLWRDDPMQAALYQSIGGVAPVSLNIPEVLPNLNTGAINIVIASPLFAEQLQWAAKLDTIFDDPWAVLVGALVISKKRMDALSPDLRQIVIDTGKVAASALTTRIRNEDTAALKRLKKGRTVGSMPAANRTQWSALFKQVRTKLSTNSNTFDPALIAKLEGYAK